MTDSIFEMEKEGCGNKSVFYDYKSRLSVSGEEEMNRKQLLSLFIGALSVGFGMAKVSSAQASSLQAPLFYEYNLKGPVTVESDVIETAGTITSLAGYWNSDGNVTLEASANGGVAYVPITNGRLLKEGFVPGNQLRFKVKISEGGFLRTLMIGYEDTSGLSKLFRNQDLSKFKYHRAIYVTGANEELFNFPVKITVCTKSAGIKKAGVICEGEIQPDFRDIRFTAADSQVELPYYLENVVPDSCALMWVKVPQIPTGGIEIYMYYGNKEAVSVSNPERVFSFYDDFEGNKLSEEKWLVKQEFDTRLKVTDGNLELKGCSITSRVFRIKKGVLEFKAKAESNAAIQAIAKGFVNKQLGVSSEQMVYSSSYPGAEHTIAINDVAKLNIGKPIEPLKDYLYKVIVNSEGISFERYSGDYEKQAEIKFLDTYQINEGYIGLKAAASPLEGGSVYFDWVRVRPYTEVEPKVVIVNQN